MSIELDRMDWENARDEAKRIIRGVKMSLLNAEMMLERAENEIKKLTEDLPKE